MIDHIVSHRETGYTAQEAIVAQRWDRIGQIYYLPCGMAGGIMSFLAPKFTNDVLSNPSVGHWFFIFNVVAWTFLFYGLFLIFLRLFRRRLRNV